MHVFNNMYNFPINKYIFNVNLNPMKSLTFCLVILEQLILLEGLSECVKWAWHVQYWTHQEWHPNHKHSQVVAVWCLAFNKLKDSFNLIFSLVAHPRDQFKVISHQWKQLYQIHIWNIMFSRALGLDLVIRDEEGGIQDPFSVSTVSLFKQHEIATQRIGQHNDTVR